MELIGVWGSQGSGKSTVSLELAKKIVKETNENCLLIFCEDLGSPLSFLFPGLSKSGGSLGDIITSAGFSQDELKKNLVNHPKNQHLAFLGYREEESKLTYPTVGESQVIDLFITLKQIFKYIVVDCKSDFTTDLITKYVLQEGKCLMLGGGDLKSVAFFNATLPLMNDYLGFRDRKIKAVNNPWDFETWRLIADKYVDTEYFFPYCAELQKMYLEERNIDDLDNSKRNRDFTVEMNDLTLQLLGLESISKKEAKYAKKIKKVSRHQNKVVEVAEYEQ